MANSKISALTAATTPVAGTETLPIVQSGSTKKVSIANLTAGRAVDVLSLAATSTITSNYGIYAKVEMQATGITDASVLFRGTPDGSGWEHAKIVGTRDASTYTYGSQLDIYTEGKNSGTTDTSTVKWTFDSLGNLIQRIASKGINFTANTGAAGKTSQLLNWYEEGTFTPTYGGSTTNPTVTYSEQVGYYTRIGRLVTIGIRLVVTSATGGSGDLRVNGLPFTGLGNTGGLSLQFVLGFASNVLQAVLSGTSLVLYDTYAGTSNTQSPVSALTSAGGTTYLVLGGTYMV